MSTLRQLGISKGVQMHSDPPGTNQNSSGPSKWPETLLSPWMWVIPFISGILKGITHPINDTYLNAESSLTTKLLPNPHYFNPRPAMSYADLAPIGLASQHLPDDSNVLELHLDTPTRISRLLQLSSSKAHRYIQTTPKTISIPPGSFWDHCGSSSGTPGIPGKCGKVWPLWKTI